MITYILAVLTFAALYVLLGLALNLQWGHTGLVNFGFVAFFAIGAYLSALLSQVGLPILVSSLVAAVVAALFSYPLGRLTIRLGADYFAIVTFGFAEIVRVVFYNSDFAGGAYGLSAVPVLFAEIAPEWRPAAQFAAISAVAVVTVVALHLILESPYGRLLRAIREHELATQSVGKDTTRVKLAVLAIGSGIAGVAGALYAHYIGFISPDQFDPTLTFVILTGVLLGGNSNIGAALGTVVLLGFVEGSRFLGDLDLPLDASVIAQIRVLIVGVLLILLMRFRPQGLWPYTFKRRLWTAPETVTPEPSPPHQGAR